MRIIIILLIAFFYGKFVYGQKTSQVDSNTLRNAIKLRRNGKFQKAIETHRDIYKKAPKFKKNVYHLARLYGHLRQKDSCIKFLNKSVDYLGLSLISEPDFYFLHSDPIWVSIEKKTFKIMGSRLKNIKDPEYAKNLWRLSAADQTLYSEISLAKKKYGIDSKEVQSLWKRKKEVNSKNQLILENLLSEKGWPLRSQVGLEACRSAFLIIQHSDINKMKKYIPTIKKLCNEGEGSCQAFALLYDRIKTIEGKPQRYGTQVRYNKKGKRYELFPLENEGIMVHEYREWAGLSSLEDYVDQWDIKLNLQKCSRNYAYADSLVSAKLSKESKYNYFHGLDFTHRTKSLIKDKWWVVPVNPKSILGQNKRYCLTMPGGTEIIVMFVDEQIINYPDQADIFIKEHGGANDRAVVYVSHDGIQYDSLGITYDDRTSSLDLEAINYSQSVKYVKIISLDNHGVLPGYDLGYIKGLPGAVVSAEMTPEMIKSYLKKAKNEINSLLISDPINNIQHMSTNELLVLDKISFNFRSTRILNKSLPYLNQLLQKLKETKWKNIEIIGHTDNKGSISFNQNLSYERAVAIRNFLFEKGIPAENIKCIGKGATQPLRSNATAYGRAENRRVELKIIK